MDRGRLTGIGLVVVSALGFGSGGLFAKPVYAAGVDWLTLLSWRFLVAAVLGWAVLLARPGARRALVTLPGRASLATVGLGIVYVGNSGTYYAALQSVPLSLAALIVYLYPPVVAVLALRFGRRLQGVRAWSALGVALLGVVLALGGIPATGAPPVDGLVLVVASPLIYAGWIILAARLAGERADRTGSEADDGANTAVVSAILMTSTASVYWAIALLSRHPVLPADVPAEAWPGIIGVAIVATFIPVRAFYGGTLRIGAAQASLISTVEPLWTIVTASLLYGERLAPVQLVGGALILAGVLVAQTGGPPPTPAGADAPADTRRDSRGLPRPVVRIADE